MTTPFFRSSATVALASLLATSLAPVGAMAAPQVSGGRGVYVPAVMRTTPDIAPTARDHPGGRGWGGRGGWGGGRHDHDDGGAVLAGLLVLGGIAAIAVAASNADKHKPEQRRSYPDNQPDPGYGDSKAPSPRDAAPSVATGAGSIDAAVDTCVDEVERGADPVDTVDSVNNAGDGWQVQGRVRGGKPFACRVTGDGQIRTLTVDGHAPAR